MIKIENQATSGNVQLDLTSSGTARFHSLLNVTDQLNQMADQEEGEMAILEQLDVHVRITSSVVTTTVPPHFGIFILKADPALSITTTEDTVSDDIFDCLENRTDKPFSVKRLTEKWKPDHIYYDQSSTEDRQFYYMTAVYKPPKGSKRPLGGACSDEHLPDDSDKQNLWVVIYIHRFKTATAFTANASMYCNMRVKYKARWTQNQNF